ncbi:MAG: crossover junction endodeoxyribonuclease RuvC [bacterium]|nr:crossover junction endodeoxyribonuclease RuvC [bacterium]
MKILAIDPGFERLGIAVLQKKQKGQEELLYSACFKTSPKIPFSKRLLAIGNEIEKIIKKYNPDALAIETLFFNTNQKTAMRVAEARGVIIFESQKNDLGVFEYTPLQIKIAITGYGKATKDQVAVMVSKLIKLNGASEKNDDELDAIAIGLTHSASSRPVEK